MNKALLEDITKHDVLNMGPRMNMDIHSLFTIIEAKHTPEIVKEGLLEMLQLYTDGLVEKPKGTEEDEREKRETLNSLCNITTDSLVAFYREQQLNIERAAKLKEIYGDEFEANQILALEYKERVKGLNDIKEAVINHSLPGLSKYRHLKSREVMVQRFLKNFAACYGERNFGIIVGIASGAIEPALLLSAVLEKPTTFLRMSHVSKFDRETRVPSFYTKEEIEGLFKGKDVIIVEDLVSSGESLAGVMEKVKQYNPNSIVAGIVLNFGPEVTEVDKKLNAKKTHQGSDPENMWAATTFYEI